MKEDDTQVRITPYNSEWKELFEREKKVLLERYSSHTSMKIEHVGSTSIPGLISKPVVDMIVGVSNESDIEILKSHLTADDYELHPYQVGEDIVTLRRGDPVEVHLHLLSTDTERWNEFIVFRDALENNESLRTQYEKLKRDLAEKYSDNRSSYTAEKGIFIRKYLDSLKEGN